MGSRRDASKCPIFLFSSILAIFDSKKKPLSQRVAFQPEVEIRFPCGEAERKRKFLFIVKISITAGFPVHPSPTLCTSDFRQSGENSRVYEGRVRAFALKIRNRRLSCIIKTRRCVCTGTRARNCTQIRWSVYVCRCVCVWLNEEEM